MRFVLAAAGSRGDVLPFGALAARLQDAGHDVVLVTHAPLLRLVPPGVPVAAADSDPARLLAGPAAEALRRGSLRGLNRTREEFAAFLASFHAPVAEVLPDADLLVASTLAVAAVDAALERGVPVVRGHLWPEAEGIAGPMPLLPFAWALPGPARAGARAALRRVENYLAGFDGGWRRGRLRLNAHHPAGLATTTRGALCAASPRILPELPPGLRATGWWWPEGSGAPAESQDPANPQHPVTSRTSAKAPAPDPRGRPRAVVGFGSMPQARPERLLEDLSWAADRAGVRIDLQLPGWEGCGDGTVRVVGERDHAELFAGADLVVHHGGAGTTGAALRAGVPAVAVPHFGDQYWWGHRLHVVGAGTRPLPRALMTRERLARRLEEGLAADLRRAAADLGGLVRAEDGTAAAVRFLEAAAGDAPARSGDRA